MCSEEYPEQSNKSNKIWEKNLFSKKLYQDSLLNTNETQIIINNLFKIISSVSIVLDKKI